jgi:hypothetical protein
MQANEGNLRQAEAEYHRLWGQRQFFSAIARLSRIWWWTEHSGNAPGDPRTAALLRQEISSEVQEAAKENARGILKKLERILAVGDTCTLEEVVLMITLRVDFWLADCYLRAVHAARLDLSTDDVDAQIRALTRDPAIRRLVHSADEHVKRHGGVNLHDCALLD